MAIIGAQCLLLEIRFTCAHNRHDGRFLIFAFILAEFGFYVLIRQIINAKEWLSACRPPFIINCPHRISNFRVGSGWKVSWKDAAHTLDEYLEFDTWKAVAEDSFYNWKLVNKVRRPLRTLREENDVRGLLGVLEMCVRHNFGGVESARCVMLITSEPGHGLISYFDRLYSEVRQNVQWLPE